MTRKHLGFYALALFCALCLTACNSFETNAYKTIKSCAVAYDAAMEAANEHYEAMDDADEKEAFYTAVMKYAEPVQAALVTAKEAAKAYSRAYAAYTEAKAEAEADNATSDDSTLETLLAEADAAKEAASAALNSLSDNLDSFKAAIQTIIGLF